jgi:nucleotide-binding universal stress UspA family protein
MPSKNQLQIKKILVAVDKSGYKDKAMSYAMTLAKSLKAEVTIIHVIEGISDIAASRFAASASIMAQKDYQVAVKKEADELLKGMVQLGIDNGITVRGKVLTGLPVKETILNYAKNQNVDLIVVGTKGMTGIVRFLMGSVANEVIAHAHCPVLAVR